MHAVEEARERGVNRLERAVVVEVVRLDVGDDRSLRSELQEGPVVLAGLGDEPAVRRRRNRVRAQPSVQPADEGARLGRARSRLGHTPQEVEQHPRAGRLAVRAGDRERAPRRRQPPEQLGVLEHRQAASTGLDDLRIVVGEPPPTGHGLGAGGQRARLALTELDREAELAQHVDEGGVGPVVAADLVPAGEEMRAAPERPAPPAPSR